MRGVGAHMLGALNCMPFELKQQVLINNFPCAFLYKKLVTEVRHPALIIILLPSPNTVSRLFTNC